MREGWLRFFALVVVLGGICLGTAQSAGAATTTFASWPVSIGPSTYGQFSSGPLTPYPSTFNVTGLGTVTDVNVDLGSITTKCLPDLDVLLVGPGGQKTMVLGDSGVCEGPNWIIDARIDDEAASKYPGCEPKAGTWRPTDDACVPEADPFTAPASPGPYPLSLSVFDGRSANGTWSLFVFDDNPGPPDDGGSLSRGWSLTLTTTDPPPPGAAPTCEGTPATIVGTAEGDTLKGTSGRDVIVGLGGNDRVSAGAGNDLVCGAEGGDRLLGRSGVDTLIGGPGRDILKGGKGRDRCPKAGRDRHKGCRVG
jgi:hypothetical protein